MNDRTPDHSTQDSGRRQVSRAGAAWKASLWIGLLLTVLVVSVGAAEVRNGVDFSDWLSGAQGMLEATQRYDASPKPILVYFYTDWCGYCRQFERQLLSSKELQNYLDDEVLAVRINPEHGGGNAQISDRYRVRGYPALFVHSANSKVISRIDRVLVEDGKPRLMTPNEFIEVIERAGAR